MAPLIDQRSLSPHDRIIRLVRGEPVTVDEKLTMRSVAAVLSAADIGAVLVHHDSRPIGIVSERDVVRAVADDAEPETVWSADVMSEDLRSVDADAAIVRVAFRMIGEGIRHLAVTKNNDVVGVVSSRDVFAVLAEDALKSR